MPSVASPAMRSLALAGLLTLAGCGEKAPAPPPEATETGAAIASASGAAVESEFGTPIKDRVATLGLLNKRNNITQDIVLKSGESRRIGNAIVKLATCEKTAPWEDPPETGAFVQLFVEERASTDQPLAWRKVFSGWLFRNAPSLSVVEHPVYDVWVKDCAMTFPGEEEPVASARNAAKPSGNASAAASPNPGPKPATSPSPTASASARPAATSAEE
ncbi:hypothetical protein NJ75_00926 [Novosphingobium subterraneum]|jgi:hypothetical protein|uniref:DUF2155 domain-containing protein n=1 Tax=Novosphingobium subterraneum TaxID=48936 RepID=A0A0B8ZRM0_9SPHN|nr:hypothetical protein NJ75_00926 [Novosphingobium subterraneum]